jgi:hypothetical protein
MSMGLHAIVLYGDVSEWAAPLITVMEQVPACQQILSWDVKPHTKSLQLDPSVDHWNPTSQTIS